MQTNTAIISDHCNSGSTMSNILATSVAALLSVSNANVFSYKNPSTSFQSINLNDLNYTINQAYINKDFAPSIEAFYDSIVNRPIDKDVLRYLIEDGYSTITSYDFLESNEEIDASVEEFFGSIERKKSKKVIFRRRSS